MFIAYIETLSAEAFDATIRTSLQHRIGREVFAHGLPLVGQSADQAVTELVSAFEEYTPAWRRSDLEVLCQQAVRQVRSLAPQQAKAWFLFTNQEAI